MPNLRKLSQSGTNFVRTYAESPQCVPSRASMFTGRYVAKCGTDAEGSADDIRWTHEIKAWSNEIGVALGMRCLQGLVLICSMPVQSHPLSSPIRGACTTMDLSSVASGGRKRTSQLLYSTQCEPTVMK